MIKDKHIHIVVIIVHGIVLIRFSLCCLYHAMSQFFSVYSLSLCSLIRPKCLGYERKSSRSRWRRERGRRSPPCCYDRAYTISRSERRTELLRYPGRKKSDDVRREKKSANVLFARFAETTGSGVALSSPFCCESVRYATRRVLLVNLLMISRGCYLYDNSRSG